MEGRALTGWTLQQDAAETLHRYYPDARQSPFSISCEHYWFVVIAGPMASMSPLNLRGAGCWLN